jgi:hypothetical protein
VLADGHHVLLDPSDDRLHHDAAQYGVLPAHI